MFIGREKELNRLNQLYNDTNFQFVVMFGRRRIGKTEILKEFSKNKNVIFYSAIEKQNNLEDFSKTILSHFNESENLSINTWQSALEYISNHSSNKIVLIIDEFPYIAKVEPYVKSIFQHTIDHIWKDKNIMLILCGSSVSFMVNVVMGRKSPLYGRNTSVMEVLPFDYDMVDKFLPNYTKEEQLITYGILGGVPYYLSKFSKNKTLLENIANTIIDSGSQLKEEPITLLKAELREPMTYNEILEAIANGATKLTEIADKTHIAPNKLPVYLKSLIEMRIIDKIICAGEKKNSKKSQYIIKDNFFAFWYRFVFANQTKIDFMEAIDYVKSIKNNIQEYMGFKFKNICYQYLKKEAKKGNLPFIPSTLGKWWGTNPSTKKPDDIDILGIDQKNYLFCECKFKNEKFDLKELNNLINISSTFKNAESKYYYIFIKSSFSSSVIQEAQKYNIKLITINDM